jgi:phenylalanyl-tRNA synthetase beta chain
MRLVVSWLREFVDVTASAEDIAEKVSLRGFEVAGIEHADGDSVIDFEITANRPDCLSVLGLAREVATTYALPLRLPSRDAGAAIAMQPLPVGDNDRLAVSIDDDELCPRYAAAVAQVSVGPSPAWMAARLHAAGVRPISSIVDVTNYVNIEIGQPMHAFDLARLAGAELRPRRAKPGETIRTLDGVDRTLDPEILVIADRDRAQAVAGVMGGARSEVSSATTFIAFESAYFKPASVRRTSKKLNLKTEASTRFERGADIGVQVAAIERAVALMMAIGAGTPVGPIVDRYTRQRAPRQIHLRRDRLALLLGAAVPDADAARILAGLGLGVTATPDGWDVVAPTFRVDLLREADLIEEVGRHFGFDRLPATFPPMVAPAPAPDRRIPRDRLIRRIATAAGFSEAVTFGFIEAKAAEAFPPASHSTESSSPASAFDPFVRIANPLTAKFDTLRPSLLPGLVDAVAHNRRHGRRDVRLFEIGTRFSRDGETRGVGAAWTGGGNDPHWSAPARDVDFFDVKGLAEAIGRAVDAPLRFDPLRAPFLVDGQAASIVAADGPAGGRALGLVGQIAPSLADARGLPRQDRVFVLELNLDVLDAARIARSESTQSLPRYPFVVRDLSIVVADALPAAIIRGTMHTAARDVPAPLAAIDVFDRYQGKGVPDGSVSLSLRLTFQAADRTLTDAEVQHSVETILAALVREHGAIQR